MANTTEISPGIFTSSYGKKSNLYNFQSIGKSSVVDTVPTTLVPSSKSIDKGKSANHGDYVSWGSSNDTPNKIVELIRKIGVAGTVVRVATAAHYGTGLTLFEEDENGTQQQVPFRKYPNIVDYDKKNRFNLFYSEFINDLEIHEMGFVEFGLSADFSKIVYNKRHDAVFCRFSPMNNKTGRIEKVLLNPDWINYDDEYTQSVACFSQYDYIEDIQNYCKEKKIFRFIIPFHYVKNGSLYYTDPLWQAPLKNGWADIIMSVPAVKRAISENQIHVKYLIHVSEKYFEQQYGINEQTGITNWDNFTPEIKLQKQKELMASIDEHLAGQEAYGRSIFVPLYTDREGKSHETIKIIAVDDKIKDGAYLPDATAGNSEIAVAKGVDLSIVGIGIPGGQNQSGSGSDKREAYTILCANMVINRSVSLLVFYFIRDWNNWGENLIANFPNAVLTTLDKNPSGTTTKTF